MKKSLLLFVATLCLSACYEPVVVDTFGSISGVVQDANLVAPLAGVRVALTPLGTSQLTGQDGTFLFDNLDVQEYTLIFTKDGYQSEQQKVSVKPGYTSSVHMSMTPLVGAFVVSPAELDFGTTSTLQRIQIRNLTGNPTSYSASTSSGWLFISPNTGEIAQSDYLTVMVSREGLSPGDYSGEITIKYVGETLVVPVIMSIPAELVATVTLESVSDINTTSATVSANLSSIGSSPVTKMGFCWSSTNSTPTISDLVSNQGDATTPCSFSAVLTNLSPGTEYYCRAYAYNSAGIAYSTQTLTFTTQIAETPDPNPDPDPIDNVTGGLFVYYNFDDLTFNDKTNFHLDGRPINSPSFEDDTPSGIGKAVFLNSVKKQAIQIDYNIFEGLDTYSISMWIKDFQPGLWLAGLKSSSSDTDCPIIFWQGEDFLVFDSFGISAYHGGMSLPGFTYSFSTIQSHWHHIVIMCKKVGLEKHIRDMYIDSRHVSSNEYTVASYRCSSTLPYKVTIGGDGDGDGRYRCSSFLLDNFRFYSRVLTDDDIKTLYNNKL